MNLDKLIATRNVLSSGAYTADSLARRLKCSRPAAERRIAGLQKLLRRNGSYWKVKTKLVRTGARGPASRAYYVE